MPGTHTWHSHNVLWLLLKLAEPASSWDACAHCNLTNCYGKTYYPFMNTTKEAHVYLVALEARGTV